MSGSFTKEYNYNPIVSYTSNYGGGINRVLHDISSATWTPSNTGGFDNSFSYGYSDVSTSLNLSATRMQIGTLTFPSNATITAPDWDEFWGTGTDITLTTSVYDYLMGDTNQHTYIRYNALGQLYYAVSTYTVGGYGYNGTPSEPTSTYMEIQQSTSGSTTTLTFVLHNVDVSGRGPTYSYNRKYSGTKNVRIIIDGYNYNTGSSVTKFTCTDGWEDPSFFDPSQNNIAVLSGGSITSGSGNLVTLTVKNPFRLNYGFTGGDKNYNYLLGFTGSHTATSASDPESQTYQFTISSRDDWMALRTGFNGWATSYSIYAYMRWSTSSTTDSWNVNTYLVGAVGHSDYYGSTWTTLTSQSNSLEVKPNNNYVGDLSPATLTHTTPGASGTLASKYIDGKTTVTFNLNGMKVPYWHNPNFGGLFVMAIFSNAAGTYTQTERLFSATWGDLLSSYSTVSNDELILTNVPNATVTFNLHMPYTDNTEQFNMKLAYRYMNSNSELYQRGSYNKLSSEMFWTYKDPEITTFEGNRYSEGTVQSYVLDEIEGEIAGIYAEFNCASINNNNILSVHSISVKEATAGASVYWTSDISSGVRLYKPGNAYLLDIEKSYTVTLTLTDSLGTTVTSSITIPTGVCFLDFHRGGTGMAIGKVSEGTGLEINLDSYFLQDIIFGKDNEPININFSNANVTGLSGGGTSTGNIVIANGKTLRVASGGTMNVQGIVKGLRQSFVIPYVIDSSSKVLIKMTQFNDTTYYFELDGKVPFNRASYSGMNAVYTYSFIFGSGGIITFPDDTASYFLTATPDSLQTGGITNNALFPCYASANGDTSDSNYMVLTVGVTSNITGSGNPTFPSTMPFNFHLSGLIPVVE